MDPAHGSYLQYLARISHANHTFEWLYKFFKYRPSEPNSEILVLDVENGNITHRPSDRATLMRQPDAVQMRLILFRYQDIWTLDRVALDDICYTFDLDPYMLWVHFDHEFSNLGGPFRIGDRQERNGPFPPQFPSSQYVNHVWKIYSRPQSILATFSTRRGTSKTDEIHSWANTRTLDEAVNNQIEFIIPITRLFVGMISQRIERGWAEALYALEPLIEPFWGKELSDEERVYYPALMQARQLSRALSNLRRFSAPRLTRPSPMLQGAFAELQDAMQEAERLRDTMKDRLGRRVAMLSLRESQKSITIADSLQTLTQLAFVFVPLNFGVAIFGANIREFGSGVVPAWALPATAAGVCFLTVMFSWLWAKKRKYNIVTDWHYVVRPVFLFSLRSPALAAVLVSYILTHGDSAPKVLNELTISYLDWRDENDCALTCDLDYFPRAPEGTSWQKAFWPNRLHSIGKYTSQKGWGKDRFWKRRSRGRDVVDEGNEPRDGLSRDVPVSGTV
ncbi:hypothetical protein OQA88_7001 [Cercophora sp. LCS_1]